MLTLAILADGQWRERLALITHVAAASGLTSRAVTTLVEAGCAAGTLGKVTAATTRGQRAYVALGTPGPRNTSATQ